MTRILATSLFLCITLCTPHAHAMQSADSKLLHEEYDGIVNVVLSNKSGQSVLVGSLGHEKSSFTVDNNATSQELPLYYYSPVKSLFDKTHSTTLTFSSKKGVYSLIMWKKKNDTMRINIQRDNKTERALKNILNGQTITLEIDKTGTVKLLEPKTTH